MPRTAIAVCTVLATMLTQAACKKKSTDGTGSATGSAAASAPNSGNCPAAPDRQFNERFAVGVLPDFRVEGLVGHAASCHTAFKPGAVVATRPGPDGTPETYLATAGVFEGFCPGETVAYKFESVPVASLSVTSNGIPLAKAAFDIALDRPTEHYVGVVPQDRCGFRLSRGVGHGNARWSMGPGCDKIVAAKPSTLAGAQGPDGFNAPADDVALVPLAAGTCTLGIDYLGTKGEVTVTVK